MKPNIAKSKKRQVKAINFIDNNNNNNNTVEKLYLIFFVVAPCILKPAQFTHSPTNALFMNLVKHFKFTVQYTIISLLHVSVFNDHHQGGLSVPN